MAVGRQPTRLPRPWDSPGKNTGVGCHFLLQCMKVESAKLLQSCPTLCDPIDSSPPSFPIPGAALRALCPGECLPGVGYPTGWGHLRSLPGLGHGGGAGRGRSERLIAASASRVPSRACDAVSQGREGDGPGLPASVQGPGERWAEEGTQHSGWFTSLSCRHFE